MKDEKELEQEIERLTEENELLKNVEETHHIVSEQRDRQMKITQELTFMLLHMEAMEDLMKNDLSSIARTVRKAINRFKSELMDGFADNHLVIKNNNNNVTIK